MNCPYCQNKASSLPYYPLHNVCYKCSGTPTFDDWDKLQELPYRQNGTVINCVTQDMLYVSFHEGKWIIEYYPNSNTALIASEKRAPAPGEHVYNITTVKPYEPITPSNFQKLLKLKAFL